MRLLRLDLSIDFTLLVITVMMMMMMTIKGFTCNGKRKKVKISIGALYSLSWSVQVCPCLSPLVPVCPGLSRSVLVFPGQSWSGLIYRLVCEFFFFNSASSTLDLVVKDGEK